jgi:hypothetical protein
MEPSKDQKITRIELSLLRLCDGIASKADKERLAEHCSVTDLQVWERLSTTISSALSPTHSIDVAESTLQRLQAEHSNLQQISASRLRNVLLSPQVESESINITDAVMASILTEATPNMRTSSIAEPNTLSNLQDSGSLYSEASDIDHESEDWSLQEGLRSALRDTQGLSDDFTDSIMQRVLGGMENTEAMTESSMGDLEEDVFVLTSDYALGQVLEDELSNLHEDSELDVEVEVDFDQALMLELEATLLEEGEDDVAQQGKLDFNEMSVVNTVASKIVTADVVPPELDVVKVTSTGVEPEFEQPLFDDVVEYTEEEFVFDEYFSALAEYEEDSDDLCSVQEELVTEAMLEAQSQNMTQQFMTQRLTKGLQGVLLHDIPPKVNIWNAIASQVNRPPLRLLRDDIEVIDKVPTPENVDEANADDTAVANVEFINSKSIDADSTISKVSITVLASFLTLAAAWMIIVLPSLLQQNTSSINTPKPTVTFELAEVNHLEVEDLEVAENMNVQILQGDENAPTIIFIDDMETL